MKKSHLLTLAALSLCTAAAAQTYAIVGVGISTASVDCTGVQNCDKTGRALKLVFGHRFTPNWAGEFSYQDYGKAKATDAGVTAELGNTALVLGMAWHQDFTPDWNLALRLGLGRVKTKIGGSVPGLGSASDTDTHTAAVFGASVGYRLSPSTSLDLAWDGTRGEFSKNGLDDSGRVNAYTLGLNFKF